MSKKNLLILFAAVLCLCSSAFGLATYTVTNTNNSGTGSFAAALASAESDGQDSRIEFSVGGTIYPTARYNITAGNCTICATDAPSGVIFDFGTGSEGFRVTSNNNRFCNIKVINTNVNCDGIFLYSGANNVVERCSFDYCRDEAVGISGAGARGNVVAYCRIEHCGSQPGDGTDWANGRGILVTTGSSATIVGSFIYYCCRGITVNGNFGDIRNCRVENSLSPASGHGITVTGSGIKANLMNCMANNNILNGFRPKTTCTFYRTGLSGSGNGTGLITIDADCTEVGSPITVADTPFPSWLSGATTPTSLNDVGMGTGDCQCYSGGATKATNPNPANGSTSVSLTADLSWSAGSGATSHDVYWGTNSASLTFRGNQGGTTYDTGTMANGVTYYWRIDELPGPITGDLWSYTTVAVTKAINPTPSNNATGVSITNDLSWTAGTGATSHDVYFGTNSASLPFCGNQAGTTYDTGTMAYNTKYYWRINELPGPVTGDLWNFTTAVNPNSAIFNGTAPEDGYMRESTETSGVGGFVSPSNALRVGDTNNKYQQVGVFSFDTSSLADGITITSVKVSVARVGITGDPSVLGSLVLDIKNGYFGTVATPEMSDFEAAPSASSVGTLPYPTVNNSYVSCNLNASGIANINKTGLTQFKIRFTTDDDNDTANDYLNIGDGGTANYKPKLEVTWQ